MPLSLEKLQQEAEKLVALLKDEDGKGMATWCMFLNERLTNLHDLAHEAGIGVVENTFELYEASWQEADASIKKAIEHKMKVSPEATISQVYKDVMPTLQRYARFGAADTASREAVWLYIEKLKK